MQTRKTTGCPLPTFQNISDGFMVTVFSGKSDKLGNNQKLILELITNDPYISLSQLNKTICISQTAIENNISKLKEMGFLKRIGSAKKGNWEVIGN